MRLLMSKMIWICFCSFFHLEVEFLSLGWDYELFAGDSWLQKTWVSVSSLGLKLPMLVFALWVACPEPWKPPQPGCWRRSRDMGHCGLHTTPANSQQLPETELFCWNTGNNILKRATYFKRPEESLSGAQAKLLTQTCELQKWWLF